jgi:SAM-dependent methyltransferase
MDDNSTKQVMSLDIGCGTSKTQGSVGIDIVPLPDVDVLVNASKFPYPFADSSFGEIYLLDVIEHLPDTIGVMEEVHRIACPGARVVIRVVNWNHRFAVSDPTHTRYFSERSFDFFGTRTGRSYYSKARFDVERIERIFDRSAQRWLRNKRLMRFLSHFLCNVLQGLIFELRVVK